MKLNVFRFTLIELLVIISIIGILMTMLLPVLRNAREAGKKSVCANNIKQVYTGCFYYIDDYNGYLPAREHWYRELADILGIKYNYLLPGKKDIEGIFLCPSTQLWSNRNKLMLSSYGPTLGSTDEVAGRRGGWLGFWTGAGAKTPKRLSDITDNSILMLEKKLAMENWGSYVTSYDYNLPGYTNSVNESWGAVYRHSGSSNFLFKDGHIQSFKPMQKFNGTYWTLK